MPIKKDEIAKRLGDAWLDLYIKDESKLYNPLDIPDYLAEDGHLYVTWLLSNPDYFSFICKELLNIKIFPTQALVLKNMWKYKMLMLIASRGFSKTFMAAVYILLRLMLMPGRKMVICGAGFRQSKFVFDYVERIWNSSPLLRDIGGQGSGPRKDPDVYSFRFGESIASFIPIGTGDKIRGLRSNDTFCITGDSLIQTENGIIQIKDYTGEKLVNQFNELELPSRFIVTPEMDVYKVTTENGYTFKCSGDHMVMTNNGWKKTLDLVDDLIQLDTNNYFPKNGDSLLKWPEHKVKQFLLDNYHSGYSGSAELIDIIHIFLLKFGIIGRKYYDGIWRIDCNLNTKNRILFDKVKSVEKLPPEILYDFTMPKSHSFCGNGVINHNCDEFHSINVEIFQNVILGFSAVSSDPVENIQRMAALALAEQYNIELEDGFIQGNTQDNQLIISGTAYYQFNHFYKYWKDWKNIIDSRGDQRLLKGMGIDRDINWKDYCIIRIPYELVPKGFMDAGIVASAKFSSSSISYALEYGAVFSADSNGFFRRSLLEQCTTEQGKEGSFTSMLSGDPDKKYVIGIDPAFRVDNFGLVLLELNGDHKRIVYVWTSNTTEHKTKLEKGIIKENEFYLYCVQHIRSLMRKFNVVGIAIDSQGGGWAISEMLANKKNCKQDELPIYPVRDPKKVQPTDAKQGLHILDIVNFANYEYLSTANHTMRQDFEIGNLLFPYFDAIKIAMESDFAKMEKEDYSLEDCMFQVEELKNELCSIVVTETPSGREHWDTPETIENGKKGRLRKDRYSALLIANALANKLLLGPKTRLQATEGGGFAEYKQVVGDPKYFIGPDWLTSELNNLYKTF